MVRSRGGDQGSNASIDQEDVDSHSFMLLNANKRSMALSAVLPSRARPLAAVRVTLEPKRLRQNKVDTFGHLMAPCVHG